MKIAMLNCLKANDVCTGAGCLRAMNSRTGHFTPYAAEPLELVAMARCSGCEVGIDEGFREKLDRIVSEGPATWASAPCGKTWAGNVP